MKHFLGNHGGAVFNSRSYLSPYFRYFVKRSGWPNRPEVPVLGPNPGGPLLNPPLEAHASATGTLERLTKLWPRSHIFQSYKQFIFNNNYTRSSDSHIYLFQGWLNSRLRDGNIFFFPK